METINLQKNITIPILSNINPGQGQTVEEYRWSLDDTIIASTQNILFNTGNYSLGLHTLQLYARNSCGNSGTDDKIINIIEVNKMEKTVNYTQDKPIVSVEIIMDYVGTTEITVKDQLNRPIVGASIDIDNIPTGLTTGTDGKLSIQNVAYGSHVAKAIIA